MGAATNPDHLAALAHAQLPLGQVRVYLFTDTGDGATGQWFSPGRLPPANGWPPLAEPDLEDAAHFHHLHKIALNAKASEIILSAKLRHELEHCRQWELHRDGIFYMDGVIQAGLASIHGSLRGLPHLTNLIPTEADAHGAASAFAWDHFGSACEKELGGVDDILLRHHPAPAVLTVASRQLAFGAIHASTLEAVIQDLGHDVPSAIRSVTPVGGERWHAVAADDEVRQLASEAMAASPAQDAIDATQGSVAHLWREARLLTIAAYERALQVAELQTG